MIRIFSLKQQGKDGTGQGSAKKSSAAQLRVQKGSTIVQHDAMNSNTTDFACVDIAELNLPKTCKTDFPNPDDLLNFKIIIMPDEVNHLILHKMYYVFVNNLDRVFIEMDVSYSTFK